MVHSASQHYCMYSHAAANGTDKSGNPQNAGSPPSSVRPFLIQIQCAVVSYRTAVCPYDRVLPSLLPDCLCIHRRRPDQSLKDSSSTCSFRIFVRSSYDGSVLDAGRNPQDSRLFYGPGACYHGSQRPFINTQKYGFCTRPAILFT